MFRSLVPGHAARDPRHLSMASLRTLRPPPLAGWGRLPCAWSAASPAKHVQPRGLLGQGQGWVSTCQGEWAGPWRDLAWSAPQAPSKCVRLINYGWGGSRWADDPQLSVGPMLKSKSPWLPAPASKGGGGGQETAQEAPQRPPGAGASGEGEESEVRTLRKYLEPSAGGMLRGPQCGGPPEVRV